ncbi:MAG: GGDEF domain-containing protein, partial [Gammaproteobacteria bacterium]|nr:GGDEF domain-containing protein [Gammaproteobacteria bacterium]
MKFQESSGQAAQYLRLAIPKMIKHQIIPNPLNYTLWYSYFSKTHPKLNIELEQTLKTFGTCPQIVSEQLFIDHIIKLDQQGKVENVQQALFELVGDLSETIDQTSQSSAGHSDTLKSKIDQLNGSDVNPLLRELADSAQAICDNNDQFQQQIEAAKKEIDALKIELQNTKTQASTDHLTGLFNRRVFDAIFAEFSLNNGDQNISLVM